MSCAGNYPWPDVSARIHQDLYQLSCLGAQIILRRKIRTFRRENNIPRIPQSHILSGSVVSLEHQKRATEKMQVASASSLRPVKWDEAHLT